MNATLTIRCRSVCPRFERMEVGPHATLVPPPSYRSFFPLTRFSPLVSCFVRIGASGASNAFLSGLSVEFLPTLSDCSPRQRPYRVTLHMVNRGPRTKLWPESFLVPISVRFLCEDRWFSRCSYGSDSEGLPQFVGLFVFYLKGLPFCILLVVLPARAPPRCSWIVVDLVAEHLLLYAGGPSAGL